MTIKFKILCKSSIEYGALEPLEAVILSGHIDEQETRNPSVPDITSNQVHCHVL